ncbi:MAG: hypothetical protein LBE74_09555 [Treponema sp.]|jgi:hypothetical protein|nr:hypothetical protein [Treponema sp.]
MLDVIGKLWALPCTIAGIIVGAILLAASRGRGGYVRIRNNAVTFTTGLNLGGSITLGNVVVHAGGNASVWNADMIWTRYDRSAYINIGAHEEAHTYQYQKYGVLMPILWLAESILKGGIGKGRLEIAADDYAEIPGTRRRIADSSGVA